MNTPLDDGGWEVHIVDSPTNYFRTARLYLFRQGNGGTQVVKPDGTITQLEEGVQAPEDAAFQLPVEAINAIAKGIERYQGRASHTHTEVQVLRESLERAEARVDKVFDWAIKVNGS